MKIKYSIKKSNELWIVWKETETEHGYGCKGIFQGTRIQCQRYIEELNEKI